MNKEMLIAAKKVLDEINAMSDEEFQLELEKHKDGDIANALMYACDSSFQPDDSMTIEESKKSEESERTKKTNDIIMVYFKMRIHKCINDFNQRTKLCQHYAECDFHTGDCRHRNNPVIFCNWQNCPLENEM